MKKLKFLIVYGLKKRFFKKSFLISNIVILLLTLVIINIPTIIGLFDQDVDETYRIQLLTTEETEAFSAPFKQTLLSDASLSIDIEDIDTFDEAVFFEQDEIDMVIKLSFVEGQLNIELYRFNVTYDTYVMNSLQLLDILRQNETYTIPNVELYVPETYEDPIVQEIIGSISVVFVLPLFIILVLAIQFVGVDIIEEKSSKAIETIISSVPAMIHFISKIISSLLFIVIQGLLLIIFGWLGSIIGSTTQSAIGIDSGSLLDVVFEYFPNFNTIVGIAILFIIVGSIFYLVFAAIIAASATTQEDYQQFQAPMMITLVIGFYIAIFSSAAGAYQVLRIAAFVPLFAPMIVPIAFSVGVMTPLEVGLALLILMVFTGLTIWLMSPIYKVAILSYDQTKLVRRLKSYFKKSKDMT